jgi:hypothetical protein
VRRCCWNQYRSFDFASRSSRLAAVAFQFVQLLYWIGLSTWFGSVVFVAIAAPVIFKTVRQNNPILTDILSVNLEGQHGTLLAGSIVVDLIRRLFWLEIICGIGVVIAMAAQPFVIDPNGGAQTTMIIRGALLIAAAAVVLFDRQVLWPRLQAARAEYVEHADEPDIANPAKDKFDSDQRVSVALLTVVTGLLLGIIVFSTTIRIRPTFVDASASR